MRENKQAMGNVFMKKRVREKKKCWMFVFFSVEIGERCICAYPNTQRNTGGRKNKAHFILQDTREVLLHNQIRQMQFHSQICFLKSRIQCMDNNFITQTQTKKNPVNLSNSCQQIILSDTYTNNRERTNNCFEWLAVAVVVAVVPLEL